VGDLLAARAGRHSVRVARLRRIVHRQEKDLTVVDGLTLTVELAGRGIPIVELYGDDKALATASEVKVLRRVAESGRAYLLDPNSLARLAPTKHPQGLLAVVACPHNPTRAEGVVVFLDRIQDPGNVGAIIRCAAALGASGVACSVGCADPFSPRSVRASGGHALLLPVEPEAEFDAVASRFRAVGGDIAGTIGHGGTPLHRWRPRPPLLVAFGNEGQGLAPEIAQQCRSLVRVPLAGGVESLNVAVATGIVLASLAGLAGAPILDTQAVKGGRE
jgi:TrmH family RNA methyltransferase